VNYAKIDFLVKHVVTRAESPLYRYQSLLLSFHFMHSLLQAIF